jgi:hypothetical protein
MRDSTLVETDFNQDLEKFLNSEQVSPGEFAKRLFAKGAGQTVLAAETSCTATVL